MPEFLFGGIFWSAITFFLIMATLDTPVPNFFVGVDSGSKVIVVKNDKQREFYYFIYNEKPVLIEKK